MKLVQGDAGWRGAAQGRCDLLCGDDGSALMRYKFQEAWPCRWKRLQLTTDTPGTLIEELEIAVEKIERA